MSVESKVAIITGGATGIGFGIAEVLASKGFKLVLAQPQLAVAQLAAQRLENTEVLHSKSIFGIVIASNRWSMRRLSDSAQLQRPRQQCGHHGPSRACAVYLVPSGSSG